MKETSAGEFLTRSVTSQDGVELGYRAIGEGPGVVLLHGGGATSLQLTDLAEALADHLTVYIPDRRGRGLTAGDPANHGLAQYAQDVIALLRETGTTRLFGVSAGAVLALNVGLEFDQLEKLALFEPPLAVAGRSPTSWVPRYERELREGKLASALTTIIKETEGRRTPRFIMVPMMGLMLRRADLQSKRAGGQPVSGFVASMGDDIRIVQSSPGPEEFAALHCEVLLLGGAESPPMYEEALDALVAVLTDARRSTIPGVGHVAANNSGRPALVAEELVGFFT